MPPTKSQALEKRLTWGSPAFLELCERLEVTRVARVTGLDRSGVEVACAVRPRGHVLQVCNGKGETFEKAAAGALLEAAELWGAERVQPPDLVWGSLTELATDHDAWGAGELGSAGPLVAPGLWSAGMRCAWRQATELNSGAPVLVPAVAVHCPPPGTSPLGPAVVAWSSNGMGAHPDAAAALLHALLEAAERDQLARALPEGWTEEAIAQRMLSPASLARAAPRTAHRIAGMAAGGFDVYAFDLSPTGASGRLGLPVAGALLVDRQQGPVPLTAGYACALDRDQALLGAVLEAAQSRLTDIHGARDDVSEAAEHDVSRLREMCAAARPRRGAASMPQPRALTNAAAGVREVLRRLGSAGHERAAAVELAPPELGLHIIKVVVPGLLVSELL